MKQTIYAPETLQGRLTEDDDLFNSALRNMAMTSILVRVTQRMLNTAAVNETVEAELQLRNRKYV